MSAHNGISCDSSNCCSCYSNALAAAAGKQRQQSLRQASLVDVVVRPWTSDSHLVSLAHRSGMMCANSTSHEPSSECCSPSAGASGGFDDAWTLARSPSQQHQQQHECQQPDRVAHGYLATSDGHHDPSIAPLPHILHPYLPSYPGTITVPAWNATTFCGLAPWQYLPSYRHRMEPVPSALMTLANFQAPSIRGRRDLICAVEFSDSGNLLAAGSVGKQVQLYGVREAYQCEPVQDTAVSPLTSHRMPSKLSCLVWTPSSDALLTMGDYDGVIYQVDVNTGHFVADIDEHSGKRILAVVHSRANPRLAASASEDGTVRLWEGPTLSHAAVSTITPLPTTGCKPALCSVDFAADDANLMIVGSADANAYIYDLRRTDLPLLVLRNHARAVSYVRFMHSRSVVTAAVDGTLAAWDLTVHAAPWDGMLSITTPYKHFTGHSNTRNFVGLAVDPASRLMACGSEDGQVFTYCTCWKQPLATASVGTLTSSSKVASSGSTHSGSFGSVSRIGSLQSLSDVASSNVPATVTANRASLNDMLLLSACRGMQPLSGSIGDGEVQSYTQAAPTQSSVTEFVSAVSWRPQSACAGHTAPLLAAATSHGSVSLMRLGLVQTAA